MGSTKRSKRAIHRRGKKESKKIIKKRDRDNGDNETFWGSVQKFRAKWEEKGTNNSHLEFFIIFWVQGHTKILYAWE